MSPKKEQCRESLQVDWWAESTGGPTGGRTPRDEMAKSDRDLRAERAYGHDRHLAGDFAGPLRRGLGGPGSPDQ
jgi:hypothetical protein